MNKSFHLGGEKTRNLPRIDVVPGRFTEEFSRRWRSLQTLVTRKLHSTYFLDFWNQHPVVPAAQASRLVSNAILNQEPNATGRIGGVEAQILLWAEKFSLAGKFVGLPSLFANTASGATNAGIRPRNRISYKTYAGLAITSLEALDMLAVWKAPHEAQFVTHLKLSIPLCNVEHLSPTVPVENHWTRSLEGKRVLVVSPFATSIDRQIPKMAEIWRELGWNPRFTVQPVPFPYLIDESFSAPWWNVYEEIGKIVVSAHYDVALFGCGGLGLPLAALAKSVGKVGLHIGGHLQLLFGIYGQRHLEQEWHRRWINEAWIRPSREEVPPCAARVENACYW